MYKKDELIGNISKNSQLQCFDNEIVVHGTALSMPVCHEVKYPGRRPSPWGLILFGAEGQQKERLA